jgi:hypothetical protein
MQPARPLSLCATPSQPCPLRCARPPQEAAHLLAALDSLAGSASSAPLSPRSLPPRSPAGFPAHQAGAPGPRSEPLPPRPPPAAQGGPLDKEIEIEIEMEGPLDTPFAARGAADGALAAEASVTPPPDAPAQPAAPAGAQASSRAESAMLPVARHPAPASRRPASSMLIRGPGAAAVPGRLSVKERKKDLRPLPGVC